jgi:hypothetical protein
MHSTLNPKQTDPQRVLVARVDEELAHTYEQIAAYLELARREIRGEVSICASANRLASRD